MIPDFDATTGYLPPGEHEANWDEVIQRFGWNVQRKRILSGLRRAAVNLRDAGCVFFLLDGSFVTAKEWPVDFDACCDFSGMDPLKIDPRLMSGKDVMKAEFMGEVHPEHWVAGGGYTFREFFQTDRDDRPKGIIRLDLETVP
jgi:hypothetical protein